jgi:hypothetical protein
MRAAVENNSGLQLRIEIGDVNASPYLSAIFGIDSSFVAHTRKG